MDFAEPSGLGEGVLAQKPDGQGQGGTKEEEPEQRAVQAAGGEEASRSDSAPANQSDIESAMKTGKWPEPTVNSVIDPLTASLDAFQKAVATGACGQVIEDSEARARLEAMTLRGTHSSVLSTNQRPANTSTTAGNAAIFQWVKNTTDAQAPAVQPLVTVAQNRTEAQSQPKAQPQSQPQSQPPTQPQSQPQAQQPRAVRDWVMAETEDIPMGESVDTAVAIAASDIPSVL